MPQETSVKQQGIILQRSLTLPNDIDAITEMSVFVDTICEELGFDMMMTMNLNLAIEEAVVNVMNYAYPKGTRGEVHIEIQADAQKFIVIIRDSGIPFDPTTQKEVDTTLSAEERPIGGLGIHLVRQIMDHIDYRYVDKQNILLLEKNINN
jgi:sigma-B regulation protein RsbU (phosphoserine phosphatase)